MCPPLRLLDLGPGAVQRFSYSVVYFLDQNFWLSDLILRTANFFPQNFWIRDLKVVISTSSAIDFLSLMPPKPHTGESTGLVTEQTILPEAGVGIQLIPPR